MTFRHLLLKIFGVKKEIKRTGQKSKCYKRDGKVPRSRCPCDKTWRANNLSEDDKTWCANNLSEDDKTWRANNLSEDDKTWRANNLSEDDKTWRANNLSEDDKTWRANNLSEDDKTWCANNLSEDDKTWRANTLSEDDVNGLFLFCNFQMLILGLVVLHDIQVFLKHGFYFICDVNIMINKIGFTGVATSINCYGLDIYLFHTETHTII